MQPGQPAPDQEQKNSTDGYVDRREVAAEFAARYGISEACAAAGLLISQALRQAADEYPELTDAEAIEALRSIKRGVQGAGVPRRR